MLSLPSLWSSSPDQTLELGAVLGKLLLPGHVVGLVGELGSGKTCFAAGVARGAGVDESVYVSSPTFTLINQYPGRISLIHMDFYRLTEADDLIEIGVDTYYGDDCVCLVEWFDRFPEKKPSCYLEIRLQVTDPSSRQLELRAVGENHYNLGKDWVSACDRGIESF